MALNQMMMKHETRLTIEQKINKYILNPELSDVCFLVGDQREKIYAHRFFLASESDVFKSMFYGELKETGYEIEVPDLSPVGFRNMLKYFYTRKVKIALSEAHRTYMAANKYLASDLVQDLAVHLVKNLWNISNTCIAYDQLLKLPIDNSLTEGVRNWVAKNFSRACESDSFKQIDEDTLVDILKFDKLYITEFDLLKACLRWIDSKVARQSSGADPANKRAAFERIKHLVRFSDLNPSDFGSISDIENYLTVEEIGSIFMNLHQSNKPIKIEYGSPRGSYAQIYKGRYIAHQSNVFNIYDGDPLSMF